MFGFSGITRFGFYSEAELQADYDHLGALTGETPCFISTTKQSWNGARFAQYLGMLPGFDKKLFQPGNETKLKEQMASASKKYGIKPDYEDASGPKWEVLGFNGHGNPYGVEMKIVPGNAGGKQAGWLRKTASGDNEFIDIADVELLRFIGAYCRKPEIIPEACSSSGLLASGENIAEVMAKNIGGRTWGASDLAGGIADIARSRGKDGRMHIDRVIMNAAGTTSYDYRELSSLQTSTWKVTTTASGTRFEWKAQNSQNTEEYEIESSTDGKYFDRVALVPKKADGSAYVYETSSKPSGKVFYRIKQRNAAVQTYVDASHNNAVLTLKDYTFAVSEAKVAEASTGVKQDEVPAVFSLSQNYPNPFNASTTIRYSIPKDEKVKIKVYDVLGREVKTLVDREMEAGEHRTTFKAEGLASGVYIYRIEAGGEQAVKKMLLVK